MAFRDDDDSSLHGSLKTSYKRRVLVFFFDLRRHFTLSLLSEGEGQRN